MRRESPLSLNDLMTHFQNSHGFNPTRKQWKERLAKWGFRRNLGVSSAATICKLLREAEEQRISRRVFYNGHEKTLQDIRKYISKTTLVKTEQDLLGKVPPRDKWSKNVTWVDNLAISSTGHSIAQDHFNTQPARFAGPYAQPWNVGGACAPNDQGFILPAPNDPSVINSSFDLTSDLNPVSYALLAEYSDPIMDQRDWYATSQQPQGLRAPRHWNHPAELDPSLPEQGLQRGPLSSSSDDDDESIPDAQDNREQPWREPQQALDNFIQPFQSVHSNQTASTSPLGNLNLAVSVTPPQFTTNGRLSDSDRENEVQAYVNLVLGIAEDLRSEPGKLFVSCYLRAMAYLGQKLDGLCESAINEAVGAFHELTVSSFVTSLPNLNLMSFVFEVYGHKSLKKRILQRLRDSVSQQDDYKRFLIVESLEYLLDTAEWSKEKVIANKSRADKIYKAAIEISGVQSPLAVAARFNEAWLLLEGDEAEEALTILNMERSRCEMACGIYALQTISWIATQARAHLNVGESETAESLMKEVVLTRAKKAFSEDNAIYWEVTGRIGLFMMKFAAEKIIPNRTQECWELGEDLLRKTLMWRGQWLGTENPQTTKVFQLLKRYLGQQGKKRDAENLFNWYRAGVDQW